MSHTKPGPGGEEANVGGNVQREPIADIDAANLGMCAESRHDPDVSKATDGGDGSGTSVGFVICPQEDVITDFNMQAATQPRSIELFTGAGGLALATHAAGFGHAGLFEWNPDACKTLRENVGRRAVKGINRWSVVEGDVRDVTFRDLGEVDLVAGGPPCQPFSIGGKHRGVRDSRNMIPEFIRAIRELTPKAFIFENVKGLTRQTFKTYFEHTVLQLSYPEITPKKDETIADHLARLEDVHTKGRHRGLKYNVVYRVLNSANFGVPQTRERVFVVGFRSDLNCDWHFPSPTHGLDALLREQWITGRYWDRHEVARSRRPAFTPSLAARVEKLKQAELPLLKPWKTIRDAIAGLPEPRADREADGVLNHRLQLGARSYPGHTGSPIDLPSKTLKAGDHGVPGGENAVAFPDGRIRYLTVREAARVQTFPDTWNFCGAWSEAMRQLGNAVPVELARAVAASVAAKLGKLDG